MTEEELRDLTEEEFYDCFKSKFWRMNNLYHIVDKDGNDILFNFNTEQQKLWDACFVDGVLVKDANVLKARQLGITTFFVLCYLDDVLWMENINAYIQSDKKISIEKIFRIATYAYKSMKKIIPEITPELDRGGGSKHEYYFPSNNSRIYVGLEHRSATVHRLHLSETALQDKTKIGATTSAVPWNVRYSSETTPNGMNWYYDDWGLANIAYRKNFFFAWFYRDEYSLPDIDTGPTTGKEKKYIANIRKTSGYTLTKEQIEFRRMKIASLKSVDMFDQEFPYDDESCFMRSSSSVFDVDNLKTVIANLKPEIEWVDDIKIMIPYSSKDYYVCSADPAEGVGRDNSIGVILNSKAQQCAIFSSNKLKPKQFAKKLVNMCELYGAKKLKPPIMAVERNNHGHAVLLELKDYLYYPNLFYYSDDRDRPGWFTDKVTRPVMLDTLVDGVDNGTVQINDIETAKECITFVNNEGKPQAEDGKKDDRVIAMAIGVQMVIRNCPNMDMYDNIDEYILV